jgi:4-hydroxy-tetrahydrodipicolinate synthase
MNWHGVMTALITPFDPSGKGIDVEVFSLLMKRQIDAGVQSVILGGSTGEGQTLELPELEALLKAAQKFRKQIQVLGACGFSSTAATAERLKWLDAQGVDAVLVSTPPYNKAPQRGLKAHFVAIAEAAPKCPLLVYNIPGRTAVNLAPATLQSLWSVPSIQAVKESSGSIEQMSEILREIPKDRFLLSGDDPLNLPIWSLGGVGTVSVLSNVAPRAVVQLWQLWKSREIEKAQELHLSLLPVIQKLFVESNPIPTKFLMETLLSKPLPPRLPLMPLASEFKSDVLIALEWLKSKGLV